MSNLGSTRRRTHLEPFDIRLDVEFIRDTPYGGDFLGVSYLGTLDALLASGCLPAETLEAHRRSRKGCRVRDSVGHAFRLFRRPTKASPERVQYERMIYGPVPADLDQPGLRDLFPHGLLTDEPASTAQPVTTAVQFNAASEWRDAELAALDGHLEAVMWSFKRDRQAWLGGDGSFRIDSARVQYIESIIANFRANMLDALAASRVLPMRRGHLRLVVDNTSKAVAHD